MTMLLGMFERNLNVSMKVKILDLLYDSIQTIAYLHKCNNVFYLFIYLFRRFSEEVSSSTVSNTINIMISCQL